VPVGAAFSVPFLAGQKGDMPKGRARGMAARGSNLLTVISVAGRALLSVYSLSQQDKDISLRSFPHQVPEDETSCRTSRRRWPMRLATSTTGRGSPQKDDAGDPCRASLKGVPFTCTCTTPYNPRQPVNTHPSDRHSAGAVNSRAFAGRSSRTGAAASLSDRMGSRTGQSISSAGSFQRMLRSALGTYTSVHL